MVNIQLASSTPPASTTLAGASSSNLIAVPVTVVSVSSSALENLTHLIQINATATSSDGTSLTLATALGNITVSLSQQLSAAEKQNLTQQLISLIQTSKPLTLTLQAGSPPTQGTLLISATTPMPTAVQNVLPPTPTPYLSAPPLAVGDNLPAIVLFVQPPAGAPPATALPTEIPKLPATPSPIIIPSPTEESNFTVSAPSPAGTPIPAPTQIAATVTQTTLPEPLASPTPLLPTNTVATPPDVLLTSPALTAQPAPEPVVPVAVAPTFSVPIPTTQQPAINTTPPINIPSTVASPLAALLTPGNEVALRVDSVLSVSAPNGAPPDTPPLAPNQIVATVSGIGTGGQLILQAGDATLFVKSQVTAPVGTTVIVTVDQSKPAPLLTLPLLDTTNFQALPQAITALAEANPQILQQMMSNALPQPTEYLPGALLFLFSAFKQGNLSGWLGSEVTESLTRLGKFGILNSLTKELSSAGGPAQDAVVGEWRSFPIPLYAQQQFQALTLYVHNDRDARKDKAGGTAETGKIRFLIDMRLSKLGAMQIDGFVQQKKLDMILRSEGALPAGLHSELRTAYIKALGAVGYTGTLNFQVGRQYWMAMQQPPTPGIVT